MDYQWTKDLEIGHAVIDSQHKELFAAINALMSEIRAGNGKEAVTKSLDFLNNYTIKHFFDEEKLQQGSGYPDYPNHKKMHEDFKAVIRELKVREIWNGSSDELVSELRAKIGDWLVTHIKGQDIKVASHIRSVSQD
jgi:hemerythrin